ncbi:hypothetical protein Tco_1112996 [Tanacetum coccineum]|uniref:Uncharacterized protein n=1 Tax=Tanacetum coccineum TaxID=301880 RepID=A0ABQ5ITY4_9ASTR
MELVLEQTQQGTSYEVLFDESDTHVLERFNTSAGNPVKEILLKLNLPDHRILKDGGEELDSGLVVPSFNPSDDPTASLNKAMANTATNQGVNRQGVTSQARVVKCYNCQEEGAYLDPEQLAFLADNGDSVIPAQASQEIPTPAAFQTDDLDPFYSDCDDVTLG